MAYTTQTLIEQYLHRSLTAGETSFLTLLIPAIKIWIDNYTGSTFDSGVSSSRYYDGGGSVLDIDPVTSITEVMAVNDDLTDSYEYTTSTEYIAEPQNSTVKTQIIKRSGKFPSGVGRIKVTGTFSEYGSAVPEDIQLAATILAAETINQGKNASSGGNVASESLEGHSITYDTSSSSMDGIAANNPNVLSILEQHRELLLG